MTLDEATPNRIVTRHQAAPTAPARRARNSLATGHVGVITWNVQHASPERSLRQAAWLASQSEAGVLVLTEVGHGPGGAALQTALLQHGYTVIQSVTPAKGYSTILATRGVSVTPLNSGVSVLPHRAVAAIIGTRNGPLTVVGLYVPSRGARERRNVDKRAFQLAAVAALPTLRSSARGPLMITGDLNVVEPGHQPHYRLFGDWEYSFYSAFAAAGLVDTYRALHPTKHEHSWYGRQGNGYRFDHTFLTSADRMVLRSCTYNQMPRLTGLSDHAAMTTTLQLERPNLGPRGRPSERPSQSRAERTDGR